MLAPWLLGMRSGQISFCGKVLSFSEYLRMLNNIRIVIARSLGFIVRSDEDVLLLIYIPINPCE